MKRIQQQAVKHYDRMIAWAESQNSKDRTDDEKMLKVLGESWYASSCIYCSNNIRNSNICLCPLNTIAKKCCNGLWIKMESSLTWRTWLKYARLVKKYIIDNG